MPPPRRPLFVHAKAVLVAAEDRLLRAGEAAAAAEVQALLAALRPALDGAFVPLMTAEHLPRLKEVAREGDELFAGIYGSVLGLVQKDPNFGACVDAFDALPFGGAGAGTAAAGHSLDDIGNGERSYSAR